MTSPLNLFIYGVESEKAEVSRARGKDPRGIDNNALKLDDITPEISLFATGLAGRYLTPEPFSHAKSFLVNPHRVLPFSNGRSVYLPEVMNAFPSSRENRAALRLYAAVQAGEWEMGTFDRPPDADVRSAWGDSYEPDPSDNLSWIRFFLGRFPRPDLAGDIFVSLETVRVAAGMAQRFRGLREHLEWYLPKAGYGSIRMDHPRGLLWNLSFELLGFPASNAGGRLHDLMTRIARPLTRPGAVLKDTLSLVITLYALLEPYLDALPSNEETELRDRDDMFFVNMPGREPGMAMGPPQKDRGIDSADLMVRMTDSIENLTFVEGGVVKGSDSYPAEEISISKGRAGKEGGRGTGRGTPAAAREEKPLHGIMPLYYPEWDYRAGRYLKDWVSVYPLEMPRPESHEGRNLLDGWEPLVQEVSRQFRMLSIEDRVWRKRLLDGAEIEFDQLVENEIERRRGDIPSDRIYMEKRRRVREISAFVLIDLSASTSFRIEEGSHEGQTVLRMLLVSAAVVARAIEQLGDRYCICGFSGYGRDNVELVQIKSYRERLIAPILTGMDRMRPMKSTRMGAAVRHACRVLGSEQAALKLLLVLSDGFPQDHDYGDDRSSHEYGLRDTARALAEAEANGIVPFCISVDAAGHDYLRRMCPPRSYAVMKRIEDLPGELPKIYIRLRNQ